VALVFSLLLHLFLLWVFGMLPSGSSATHGGPLQVRLPPSTAKIATSEAVQAAAAAEGVPSPKDSEVAVKESATFTAPTAPNIPAEIQAAVPRSGASASTPAEDSSTQPAGLPRAGPAGVAARVEIGFEIYSGADRQLTGKGRHLYTSHDNEHFGVSIRQTFKADEAVPETPWQLEISGRITRQGLSPLAFQVQGALSERLLALAGASGNPLSDAGRMRSGRMPDGILDRQSLLYQFMMMPPSLSGGKFWLSDGTTYSQYAYRVSGFDALAIPGIGSVQTMKLVFSTADSPEIIELWLIPDKRYLPARVRHTDRLGVITEQVVVSLDAK
jgi:hypothetical protein